MVWFTENESRSTAVVVLVVLIGLAFILGTQMLKIQALKAETARLKADRDVALVDLAKVKETMSHPAVTKEPGFQIKWRERKINLTQDEKEAIAQQYEMQIADLQAILDAITVKERVTVIKKDGKYTSTPVFEPTAPAKERRTAIVAEVFNDHQTLGLAYEFIPKWGISLGLSASDSGELGGNCAVKF